MLFRVEWIAVDHTGATHRYVSHDLPETDARAMAATILKGDVSDVVVVASV